MSTIACLLVALAMAIRAMVVAHHSAGAVQVRLSVGLIASAVLAVVYAVFFGAGAWLGGWFRISDPLAEGGVATANVYALVAIVVLVALKMFVPYARKDAQLPVFDMRNATGILAMSMATGIDAFLIGIGLGMVFDTGWRPTLVALLVLPMAVLGVMFGRRGVELRPRRWVAMACLLLLGMTLAVIFGR